MRPSSLLDLSFDPRAAKRYATKMRLMAVAEKMTRYGWLVDRDRIEKHQADARVRVELFTEKFKRLTQVADLGLNGSTDAVKAYFWNDLGAPVVARAKRTHRPQFNAATLVEWATKDRSAPWAAPAAALYALRKNRKLIEFCQTYLIFSEADGRIHFGYNVLGTQTGRWTSSARLRLVQRLEDGSTWRKKYSVNAQQIPKKTPKFDFDDGNGPSALVSSLRDCFLPDPGCVLLRADYDQLELRLIAYVYGVGELTRALDAGIDVHLLTASALFPEMGITLQSDKSLVDVKNAREAAKSCAYAISYQMSQPNKVNRYPTLFKALKERFPMMTERHVSVLVKRFFSLYPEIQAGQQKVKARIDEIGFQELSLDGRRLYYPATMRGYNQALNFPMQGTGGALIDRAILEIDEQLCWDAGEQIRGQVHDELVVQAPKGEAMARVARVIEQAMAQPAQIGETFAGIPAAADPGDDWGSCVPMEEYLAA